MIRKFFFSLFFLLTGSIVAFADGVTLGKGKVTVDFSDAAIAHEGPYVVKRGVGRYGQKVVVGKTTKTFWTDKNQPDASMYYQIEDAQGRQVATLAHELDLFGPDVHIFRPSDSMDSVHSVVERIHTRMFSDDFGTGRYAIFFQPGDYRKAGLLKVPFYVHMAGLGRTPYDVQVHNIHTPVHLANDNGTCTFWRSLENLSVLGQMTYEEDETFKWAVSQAAPIRRVFSERTVRNQWKNGWVSGGFTADCNFMAPAGSHGQQQWYTRNTHLEYGRGEFAEGSWNFMFQGVELGEKANLSTYVNNWDTGGNVTFIPTTPVIREKPFLFVDEQGQYKVFRPALRRNAVGVSYSREDMGAGQIYDVATEFYIAAPGVRAAEINRLLAQGKHILFQPGMYQLEEPIRVTRPETIVMGLGWTTLIPGEQNPESALIVSDVDGVTLCSLLFDAHYSSRTLVKLEGKGASHEENPTLLADLFFRVGGFRPAPVHVDCALDIENNHVIGDHFWIWRADHGVKGSVGWEVNTAPVGLHVTGDDVTSMAFSMSISSSIRPTGKVSVETLSSISVRPLTMPCIRSVI